MTEIIDILSVLETNIKRHLPEIKKGIYLAMIDEEGRVLIKIDPKRNEYKWAGVADNEGDYFYIRHRDSGEIMIEQPIDNRQMFSCNHVRQNVKYQLRIVTCIKNGCPYTMESKIRLAMAETKIADTNQIKRVSINPTRSNINAMGVVFEETGKQKQFDKNLIFVYTDFDLMFEMNYI